jgi:hypothetical protein
MLVQLGIVDEKTLREALELQVHAKLASAVAWAAGSFVFTPGAEAGTAFSCKVEAVGLVLRVLLHGVRPEVAAEAVLPYLPRSVRLSAAGERFRPRIEKIMGGEALGHLLSGSPLASLLGDNEDGTTLRVQVYALRVAGLIDFV